MIIGFIGRLYSDFINCSIAVFPGGKIKLSINETNTYFTLNTNYYNEVQWRIQGGATGAPLKLDQLCFLIMFLNIRMLKNKAQIARESIKTTRELPGPLSGPWTPAEREFGPELVMFVRAHNLLRPPPPLNENPGSAPEV